MNKNHYSTERKTAGYYCSSLLSYIHLSSSFTFHLSFKFNSPSHKPEEQNQQQEPTSFSIHLFHYFISFFFFFRQHLLLGGKF